MTFKQALKISIKKWEIIVNKNKGIELSYVQAKELGVSDLEGWCGMCEYFKYDKPDSNGDINCPICPLFKDGKSCFNYGSLYYKWDEVNEAEAIEILNILKNTDIN